MFAVLSIGGKQYKVSPEDVITVQRIAGKAQDNVVLSDILMFGSQTKPLFIGTPTIKGVEVRAVILEQFKDQKVLVFKKRRRQNSRRKNGHRQNLTRLKILEIISA
ncbi:50S ribosomal protein L21 [Rickettsiales endosymbiont of Paramecium tredecaurelia]|uniref:50S ribosomal protein L21 n=1 Tax=Candidatus Sarmatiella mevalonica TaxID=2770581 RepID=UPI0019245587|nr:50S ribosomal protein L21 [Candidatus Sarmatiella mevalonica]MBL3284998.1 50S ribosomal protein L21 [Candidatus Sarmatiella mevalonica]